MNANGRAQYRSLRVRISQQKFDSFLSLLRRGLFRLSGSLGNGEREIKRAGPIIKNVCGIIQFADKIFVIPFKRTS